MKESNIRNKFTDCVKKLGGDVTNHEDRFQEGIPDASYGLENVNGWVEHKYLKSWPKRATTLVNPGIKKTQVLWIEPRQKTGGRCFLLIGVGKEIFLFSGDNARVLYDGITKQEYYEKSLNVWLNQIDKAQLKHRLCG